MSKVCVEAGDFGTEVLDFGLIMVGALGFEPRTLRLSGANTAYKAAALPLSYAPGSESKSRVQRPKPAWSELTLDFGRSILD